MVHIVWEFRVAPGKEKEFERHYGTEGTWVHLFRKDPAFIATELLRDQAVPGRYLTIDRWRDVESYETFKEKFAKEYKQIDAQMEALTEAETRLGAFEFVA